MLKAIRSHRDDVAVLSLRGDFDSFACPPFFAEIQRMLDDGITRVAIDLRRVSFVSSRALGTLIRARLLLRKHGGGLVLRRPSRAAREAIAILGLEQVLPVEAARGEVGARRRMAG